LRGSTLIADRVIQHKEKKPSVELEAKPAKICSTWLEIGLTAVELRMNSSWSTVEPILMSNLSFIADCVILDFYPSLNLGS
jgi:hypothetical protein